MGVRRCVTCKCYKPFSVCFVILHSTIPFLSLSQPCSIPFFFPSLPFPYDKLFFSLSLLFLSISLFQSLLPICFHPNITLSWFRTPICFSLFYAQFCFTNIWDEAVRNIMSFLLLRTIFWWKLNIQYLFSYPLFDMPFHCHVTSRVWPAFKVASN